MGIASMHSALAWDITHGGGGLRDGFSLLLWAAVADNSAATRALLMTSANPNALVKRNIPYLTISAGEGPLHMAMRFADYHLVSLLLESAADPNLASLNRTPLIHAVAYNNISNVLRWLEQFPSHDIERKVGYEGINALQVSCLLSCDQAIVSALLAQRADLQRQGDIGGDALMYLTDSDDATTDLAALLLAAGANVNSRCVPQTLKWRGCHALARGMKRLGSSYNIFTKMSWWEDATPVHNAVFRGDVALLRFLVAHRADLTCRNHHGQTAAELAIEAFCGVMPQPLFEALNGCPTPPHSIALISSVNVRVPMEADSTQAVQVETKNCEPHSPRSYSSASSLETVDVNEVFWLEM